jgi:hypothetical protein
MDVQTKKCDVCLRQKQETNHWFVVALDKTTGVLMFAPAGSGAGKPDGDLQFEDICGEECLHKRLSRWLENQTAPTTQESVTA